MSASFYYDPVSKERLFESNVNVCTIDTHNLFDV